MAQKNFDALRGGSISYKEDSWKLKVGMLIKNKATITPRKNASSLIGCRVIPVLKFMGGRDINSIFLCALRHDFTVWGNFAFFLEFVKSIPVN